MQLKEYKGSDPQAYKARWGCLGHCTVQWHCWRSTLVVRKLWVHIWTPTSALLSLLVAQPQPKNSRGEAALANMVLAAQWRSVQPWSEQFLYNLHQYRETLTVEDRLWLHGLKGVPDLLFVEETRRNTSEIQGQQLCVGERIIYPKMPC